MTDSREESLIEEVDKRKILFIDHLSKMIFEMTNKSDQSFRELSSTSSLLANISSRSDDRTCVKGRIGTEES